MRLITWNCKGAFHRKHDLIAALRPDVLVVPESAKLSSVAQTLGSTPVRSFEWMGENPRKGLAVVSYGDYSLQLHPSYDSRFRWIVPLVVTGPVSFVLFAVWTLPVPKNHSYVQPLFDAFNHYESLIGASEMVWAGDFNANFVFDEESRKYKFRDFVALLQRNGLHSLYHQQRACDHGEESDKTFYQYHHADKGYHIDYVFAPPRLHPHGFDVSIGSHADWSKSSDHAPVVCEFYEKSRASHLTFTS